MTNSLILLCKLMLHGLGLLLPRRDFRVQRVLVLDDGHSLVVVKRGRERLIGRDFRFWLSELREVRVLERLLDSESLVWVENQKLGQQVDALVRRLGIQVSERVLFRLRKLF